MRGLKRGSASHAEVAARHDVLVSTLALGSTGCGVSVALLRRWCACCAVFRVLADHLGTPRRVIDVATREVAQALGVGAVWEC